MKIDTLKNFLSRFWTYLGVHVGEFEKLILILLFISSILPWWSWEVESYPTPHCYMSIKLTFFTLLGEAVSARGHIERPIVGGEGPTTTSDPWVSWSFLRVGNESLAWLFFASVLFCGGIAFKKPLIKGLLTFFAGLTCIMNLFNFILSLVYPLREFRWGETFYYSEEQWFEAFISDLSPYLISGLSIGFYLLTIVAALMFLLTALSLTVTPLSKLAELCVVCIVVGLASFIGSYILGCLTKNPLSFLLLALGVFLIILYVVLQRKKLKFELARVKEEIEIPAEPEKLYENYFSSIRIF